MSVNVDNIASLKAISASTKKLRWVDSERAWFQSDPLSIGLSDDLNTIAPNAGSGRWLKQLAVGANNQGLVWQSITSNTALSPNYGYFVDLSASAGNVDLTLPLNPGIGQVISLIYIGATSLLKKAIVRRNGQAINSAAIDLQLYTKDQRLTLTYVSAAVGWFAESARAIESFQSSVILSKPATTTVAQNGIINYLGTQLGTGTYLNPFFPSSSPSRPRRVTFSAQIAWSNASSNVMYFADKNTSGVITHSAAGSNYADHFFILFYNSETKAPIQVKLSSLYIQWGTNGGTSQAKVLNLKGAKSLGANISYTDVESKITLSSGPQAILPQQDSRIITSPDWTALTTIPDANTSLTGNYYGNTAGAAASRFYDVNAADFYPAYMITSLPSVVNGTAFEGWEIRQMEFYGEVIAS